MAAITITIPDAVYGRVLDAVAAIHGRPATVPDPANPAGAPAPNPVSKEAFLKGRLVEHLKGAVRSYEGAAAAASAAVAADADIAYS